jgi:Mrp family chromosome partitioning ATPase
VLTCGRRDHRLVDLTKIPQIRNILAELRTRFEFIILDAPPILPLADMNLLASMADMLLVVVRAGVTPQDVVEKAVKTLKPFNRAGIILTGYEAEWATKYMHQYYITAQGGYYK